VLLPLLFWLAGHLLRSPVVALLQFFAGFCLIANGAYIAGGSVEGIGDCGVMLQTGTPLWAMWSFGLLTVPAGFWLWHRLGSLQDWRRKPEKITRRYALSTFFSVVLLTTLLLLFSPRF
ncbi:MAG: hypothetical protein KDA70_10500, partial [Planctomycetaceae bacterium]|nr:hypothetical protein [Planctomycetaceae bacterium]